MSPLSALSSECVEGLDQYESVATDTLHEIIDLTRLIPLQVSDPRGLPLFLSLVYYPNVSLGGETFSLLKKSFMRGGVARGSLKV